MGRPWKTHPLFGPNSPTEIQKEIKMHTSTTPRRKPRLATGLETRHKASRTRTRPRSRIRWLAAPSAVTAERDARAGFQTDPTWRGPAVRMRGALVRGGKLGEGRGARGGGWRRKGTSRGVRSHCLLGSVVSPSSSFRGGASGQHPRRCGARPPHLRHRYSPPVCADHRLRPRPAPATV